ncbi:hypothetical protein BLA60_08370 [Actinophytocola xinjiangensis]|uniref:Uncharacterized protein n=1 Tax=Actinophytocola xinjiangensis TaxID=485602 RepID=A0A7Z0WNY6_9PSEU|nr:hypothetical protein [Actinophytocola xinjiangensis]OLF12033.1 hypothetical protein BLA60_08370 [Actinophytocola xinjiangensis]
MGVGHAEQPHGERDLETRTVVSGRSETAREQYSTHQVVDETGEPIPGLCACGETGVGLFCFTYPGWVLADRRVGVRPPCRGGSGTARGA